MVVIDSKNLDNLMRIIPKKEVLSILHDLAVVSATYAELALDTPGFLATLFNEIAMEGINIEGYIEALPE
jgi:hypothetical protein